MPPVLTDLAASKKFVFVLFVSILVGVLAYLGVLTKPETLGLLGVLWPVYLGSQGLSDVSQKLADAHVLVQGERQALISQDKIALHTMINSLLPDVLKAMQRTSFAREPVTLGLALTKGTRVVCIPLGPDEVGVVSEDQKPGTMTVQAVFKGDPEEGAVYDRACLIVVPDDYVGPTETAARAAEIRKTAEAAMANGGKKPASAGVS
jgi:hypothetical protein